MDVTGTWFCDKHALLFLVLNCNLHAQNIILTNTILLDVKNDCNLKENKDKPQI